MRKTLATLMLGISLVANAQIKPETDMYKYIPKGAEITMYDIDQNGTWDIFWYDKNKDKEQQDDELFFDVTGDSIPDMNFKELNDYIQSQEPKLEKNV
jgi:hypothetical protein